MEENKESTPKSDQNSLTKMLIDRKKMNMRKSLLNPLENDLLYLIGIMKGNLINSINDLHLNEEKLFNIILYLLKKQAKNQYEIHLIRMYLITMTNFMSLMQQGKIFDDLNEILSRISYHMTYEILEKDNLLFRVGDKGEKFYLILRGKISILFPKEDKYKMNEEDYLKHLLKLKKMGELELLNKTIQINRHIYPIDEEFLDNFAETSWSPQTCSRKKISLRTSQVKEIKRFHERMSTLNVLNNQDEITVEEYINLTKPEPSKKKNSEEFFNAAEITAWEYHQILTKQAGDTFGEVALQLQSQKRTATLISVEKCYLGYLTKEVYNECIQEANEKSRKNNITFILNSRIFKGFNRLTFEKKLFNLFVNIKFKQGEMLFHENSYSNTIFLLKDGEYDVTMKKSLNDVNLLIKEFGGKVDDKKDKTFFTNEILYEKFLKSKCKIRISVIKDRDIIGLKDYSISNKYFCSVQCISSVGEAFIIDSQFINDLEATDDIIRENYKTFFALKKRILVEKLENFKKIRMTLNSSENSSPTFLNKKLILNTNKSISKLKTFFETPIKLNTSNKYVIINTGNNIKTLMNNENSTTLTANIEHQSNLSLRISKDHELRKNKKIDMLNSIGDENEKKIFEYSLKKARDSKKSSNSRKNAKSVSLNYVLNKTDTGNSGMLILNRIHNFLQNKNLIMKRATPKLFRNSLPKDEKQSSAKLKKRQSSKEKLRTVDNKNNPKKVSVIDCLVIDKIIENSEKNISLIKNEISTKNLSDNKINALNTKLSLNMNTINNMGLNALNSPSLHPQFSFLLTDNNFFLDKNLENKLLFQKNRVKTPNISKSSEKLSIIEKSQILQTNRARLIYSSRKAKNVLSQTNLENRFNFIENNKNDRENNFGNI